MPIHDWTRVDAAIFRAFHHCWTSEISRALNGGLLLSPSACYTPPRRPSDPDPIALLSPAGYYALSGQTMSEESSYDPRAKCVAVRDASDHHVVAIVAIVLPENKDHQSRLNAFVRRAHEAMAAGIHLLLVDLFPAGPRLPLGIQGAVGGDDYGLLDDAPPAGRPLTCVAYIGGSRPWASLQFAAVGGPLPDMPLYLTPAHCVRVPLEATYQSAWEAMPAYWRDVLAPGR